MDYKKFIESKARFINDGGFVPSSVPDWLYDFQKCLVEWALRRGRAAIFADCGLGKTPMQLSWADAIVKRENKPVLIVAPLAVVPQTIEEAAKFGINACRPNDSVAIHVVNYDRLHQVDPLKYCGVVCDESSILKSYSGATRNAIVSFMSRMQYRLLCSATPSPNDYIELGNSCEALGVMRRVEMLASYFVHDSGDTGKWRLRGHGKDPFWQFTATWARAIRKPSDLGFDDTKFILPELHQYEHVLTSKVPAGRLFVDAAVTLDDQRAERRRSLTERCETVAKIANSSSEPFIAWCSLNDESDRLEREIMDCVNVSGAMSDEEKEEAFQAFRDKQIRAIVTKTSMAAFGLNWQHCNRMSFFPSHSHEAYYQALRRCYRFGQTRPVHIHVVTTEAESGVLKNLMRKERLADEMFSSIIRNMSAYYSGSSSSYKAERVVKVPKWLSV